MSRLCITNLSKKQSSKKQSSNKSPIIGLLALSLGLATSLATAASTDVPATRTATAQASNTYTTHKPIYYGTDGDYPFSSAVRVGNTLYMSGQMGLKDGRLVKGGVKAQTKQTLDNINQTLMQYGYQKSDLVKCMVMLTDMNDFSAFNEVYKAELFHPYPVRSAFAVKDLALGGSVEIECMAVK